MNSNIIYYSVNSFVFLGFLSLSLLNVNAHFDSHFFHAGYFWKEPRFSYPFLSTIATDFSATSTQIARNARGKEVPLIDFLNPYETVDHMYTTTFDMARFTLNWYQNFLHGFFLGSTFSLYHLKFNPINSITDNTAFGDTLIFIGLTNNYDEHATIDLIDNTIKCVVLLPTGKTASSCIPYDIPNGYNGHAGLGISYDGAVGYFDWITLGIHSDILFLLPAMQEICFKAAQQPNINYIPVGAKIKPKNIWRVGTYFKADHVIGGFSFLLAYSYEYKHTPNIPTSINQLPIINNFLLKGFSQHTAHIEFSYDFTTDTSLVGPTLSFFYNHSLKGTEIFVTRVKGGDASINLIWQF